MIRLQNSNAALVVLVFTVAFLVRIPSFFVPYYNIDELTNVLFGNFIADGELGLEAFLGSTHLLTFYLYAAVSKISGHGNLTAIHLVHAVWVALTAVVFFFAGKELTGKRSGGFACGIFYGIFSILFFSKDFQAALSESFSLLPTSLALYFFFRGLRHRSLLCFFCVGLFVGFSALFKAPSGILILPVCLSLMLAGRGYYGFVLASVLGLCAVLFLPFMGVPDSMAALSKARDAVLMTHEGYIQAYQDLSFSYWFLKFFIRTLIIILTGLGLWYFAFLSVRLFLLNGIKNSQEKTALMILFLLLCLVAQFFIVTLGKRIFFHYYVFLLPSLCLLAGASLSKLDLHWSDFLSFYPGKKLFGFISVLTCLSFMVFFSDGMFRWSLKKTDMPEVVQAVINETHADDRIYVWGLVPQIYFFSQRRPASTMIWADYLAGFSPGSPAMEYMRSTGQTVSLVQGIEMDLQTSLDIQRSVDPLAKEGFFSLRDQELLTFHEMLVLIKPPEWKQLFEDFLKHPPVLFLDTSATGVRGFSNYPLAKYEVLKKFLIDYYTFEKTVAGVDFYRLRVPP